MPACVGWPRNNAAVIGAFLAALGLFTLTPPSAKAQTGSSAGRIFFSACPLDPAGVPLLSEGDCSATSNELFSMEADGTDLLQLTDNDSFEVGVVASPHHHRIVTTMSPAWGCEAYEHDYDDHLVTLDFGGGNEKALTSDSDQLCDYASDWSPDGKRILFTRDYDLAANIMTVRAKTKEITALTHHGYESDRYSSGASWIADGRRVLFTGSGKKSSDIFTALPDGSDRRVFRTDNLDEGGVTVSTDGRWLAFSASNEVYIQRRDGSMRRNVTRTEDVGEIQPHWSPDGEHLTFSAWDSHGLATIGTVERDGSNYQVLTGPSDEFERASSPMWSPDGTEIAFLGERFGGGTITGAVFVMEADGTDKRQLTEWDEFTLLWDWLTPPVE